MGATSVLSFGASHSGAVVSAGAHRRQQHNRRSGLVTRPTRVLRCAAATTTTTTTTAELTNVHPTRGSRGRIVEKRDEAHPEEDGDQRECRGNGAIIAAVALSASVMVAAPGGCMAAGSYGTGLGYFEAGRLRHRHRRRPYPVYRTITSTS